MISREMPQPESIDNRAWVKAELEFEPPPKPGSRDWIEAREDAVQACTDEAARRGVVISGRVLVTGMSCGEHLHVVATLVGRVADA